MNCGDEGGFAPSVNDSHQAIELILSAVKEAKLDGRFGIALDVAASEFFVNENGIRA